MKRLSMFRASIVLMLAVILGGLTQVAAAQENLEKIVAAWRARQDKYADVSISWNETRHLPDGSIQDGAKLSDPPIKIAATTLKFNYLLRLSGSERSRRALLS